MNKQLVLDKYNIKPIKYKKKNKVDIITTKKNTYVLKKTNNYNIYEYLKVRNFNNLCFPLSTKDEEYEITEYLKDNNVPIEQRIEDLVYITSILHSKTSFNKKLEKSKIDEIYHNLNQKIKEIYDYYLLKQDNIELEIYMSPSNYLLIRNISNIYKCLNLSKEYLEKWYSITQKKENYQYVMNHGNLDNSHLIENNNIFLINWDKARINSPIFDLYDLYIKNYKYISIKEILNIYEENYQLTIDEKYLLYINVLLIPKIKEAQEEIEKVEKVLEIVEYTNNLTTLLENNTK